MLVRPFFDHRSCSGRLLVAAVDVVNIVKPNPTHHPYIIFGVVTTSQLEEESVRGVIEATELSAFVLR